MFKRLVLISVLSITSLYLLSEPWERLDAVFWPRSAHWRIDEMASIIRRIEGPTRWCYPSRHPANLIYEQSSEGDGFRACAKKIEPASEYKEVYKNEYIQRYYRAEHGQYLCEVNLSTMWNDNRVVGSDCYYGLFRRQDDQGVGMTNDPFG